MTLCLCRWINMIIKLCLFGGFNFLLMNLFIVFSAIKPLNCELKSTPELGLGPGPGPGTWPEPQLGPGDKAEAEMDKGETGGWF